MPSRCPDCGELCYRHPVRRRGAVKCPLTAAQAFRRAAEDELVLRRLRAGLIDPAEASRLLGRRVVIGPPAD